MAAVLVCGKQQHSLRLVMVDPPSMGRNLDSTHLPVQECLKQILWEMLSLSRQADLMVERAHWCRRRPGY